MCRLFGLSAGQTRVRATFWLLEAPDSLAVQSRRNPDGYGLGTFDESGNPHVQKRPAAAYKDELFAREARTEESNTFIAHVRYATTGIKNVVNTHPFEQEERLFAHNGVVKDVDLLEEELGEHRALLKGDTDSERLFTLITRETEKRRGDVGAGIAAAVEWISENLPVFSINFVLTTETGLWALRYPESHELFVLKRKGGGHKGDRSFDGRVPGGTVRVNSAGLQDHPAVVVASERMDEDPGWFELTSGELLNVGPDMKTERNIVIKHPPRRPLTLKDLKGEVRAAQASSKTSELVGLAGSSDFR